ncbi:MAG: hypothetical protein NC906_07185, partial [Candidatus Omnitrophica bacterium]|nr:hypothetical protein [Candidatus Omnitrophota bacterium]
YCIVGNGVDLLYIDWSGAMSFKDQVNGNFAYWYKLDRKSAQKSDPLPILRVKYYLISPWGPIEIDDSKQSFDPQTGVLTSAISAQPFLFTLKSFLTEQHLLILEFIFHKFPDDGSICFALDDNRITYTRKFVETLSQPIRYSIENEMIKVEFSHSGSYPFKGIGLLDVVAPGDAAVKLFDKKNEKNTPQFPYLASNTLLQVKNIKNGGRLYCLACVVDNIDTPTYKSAAFESIRNFKKQKYQQIYELNASKWRKITNLSKIKISREIDYLYKLSVYLLKAVQFKTGAIIPSALFPNNHGCLVYWDALFDQIGLLRTNHIEEARKITEFWLLGLEKARENARKLGADGAYYGWATDFYGYDPDALKVNQIHFNGDIALSCWKYYEYTKDTKTLMKVFPVMKETIDFLISYWAEKFESGIRVKSCESLDESSYERISDTWTTALIVKGIDHILCAADILGYSVDKQFYETMRSGLMKGLEMNVKNGILFSHGNFGDLNIGSILSLIILDKVNGVDKMKTFKRFVRDVKEKSGLGWGHSSRMRCRIFPWAEFIAAIFLARNKNPLAQNFLENAIKATNSFGGFAEYIWLHKLISRNWYVSAHGTFLWAITEMLISSQQDTISLFPGFKNNAIKENLSFHNILIEGNIYASSQIKNGKINFSLYNANDFAIIKLIQFRRNILQVEIRPKRKLILTLNKGI